MFFVYLPIEMRNMFMKISAMLLVVWYSVSIIGFAVHTCSGSGRTFVATVLTGLSCDDIHPEHHCSHSHCCSESDACCGNEDAQTVKKPACCTNDFHVLLLTGTSSEDGQRHFDEDASAGQIAYALPCVETFAFLSEEISHKVIHIPDSGVFVPENVQSFFGIWRI